jgi:SulP family sulfate permease
MMVALILGAMVAGLLLMRRTVGISGGNAGRRCRQAPGPTPAARGFRYDVADPLFFGAAQRAFEALNQVDRDVHTVIIDLSGVAAIDSTGLVAFESTVQRLAAAGINTVITGVQAQPRQMLSTAGFKDRVAGITVAGDVSFGHPGPDQQELDW